MKAITLVIVIMATLLSPVTSYGEMQKKFIVQEPQGSTMDLVDFKPHLINFPFIVKYPSNWYAREDVMGGINLFFTREPIREQGDRYSVGSGFYYQVDYFVSQEDPNSPMGKTAETVFKVVDWDKAKLDFINYWQESGHTITSQSENPISGQPTLRIDYESQSIKGIVIYIKVNTHLLTITFEAPPQEYEEYKDTFEDMIKSFLFTR